jgi:hypothetical protein
MREQVGGLRLTTVIHAPPDPASGSFPERARAGSE